jgi:hypothetical protein
MFQMLRTARGEGLIRADADPELLLDLNSGAVVSHLLIRPRKHTAGAVRAYPVEMLRELGLEDETGESTFAWAVVCS